MPRTSSPRKTTSAPAKKTVAKTAAKKPAARPARKATAAKKTAAATTAPRLSLVKATPPTEEKTRRRDFVTNPQIYAAHAARLAGIPIHRIRDWTDHEDGTATRALADGSHLHYTHTTRTLRWQALCPMGAIHEYVINSPSTAIAARVHADRCNQPHATFDHIPGMTRDELAAQGVHTGPTWARPDLLGDAITETIPVPIPGREPRALADELTHSTTGTDDTQPLSAQEIADGITARADAETPKEHPQP